MKVPIKYRHIGGIPGLKVGAETIEGSGKRILFAWCDGPQIPGEAALYNVDDRYFEPIEWKEVTYKGIVSRWGQGVLWILSQFLG